MKKHFFIRVAMLATFSVAITSSVLAEITTDELVVTGSQSTHPELTFTNPVSIISAEEAESINVTTVEDFLKYEPGLIVRRRYIGDPNSTIGMRGSNMFQTARTMIFADGLPLHYHLQTRFSGAPRWSLVAPDEVDSVETVYGPFSSLYSGNAMGGVVNINTRFPEKFEFNAEASTFLQDFNFLGSDDTFFGHREFVSIGHKFDKLSVYLFHNHLENESHPMTFFNPERGTPDTSLGNVTGGFNSVNEFGNPTIYFGDSGSEEVATDLTKLKLGYDLGSWFTSLTLAYEKRDRNADNASSYITDANGNTVFSGDHTFNGTRFDVDGRFGNLFRVSYEERESLLIGGELRGPLADTGWDAELNFSIFDLIKDQRLRSNRNPNDPAFDGSGRVREYDDTGWQSFDFKLRNKNLFGRDNIRLTLGYHFDHYELEVAEHNAVGNFRDGIRGTLRNGSPSAGQTFTYAVFSEYGWDFLPHWDVVLGVRYEMWESQDGRSGTDFFTDRNEDKLSPKFSLGFTPDQTWAYRYSLAKAYRFPLVEELFENESDTLGSTIANAALKPEDGLHHNFSITRQIPAGLVSLNVFHETIEDVIFNQTDVNANVTTFLNIDEVEATGVELSYNQSNIFEWPVDIRSNVAYTDAEVTRNSANPAIEGRQFPRLPKWRLNLLATYHFTPTWDFSTGLRYASNSYGQLDNSDTATNVFGAQDEYLFVDVKTQYRFNDMFKLSAGIENVNNEKAFVFHPWPQRSYFVEGKVQF